MENKTTRVLSNVLMEAFVQDHPMMVWLRDGCESLTILFKIVREPRRCGLRLLFKDMLSCKREREREGEERELISMNKRLPKINRISWGWGKENLRRVRISKFFFFWISPSWRNDFLSVKEDERLSFLCQLMCFACKQKLGHCPSLVKKLSSCAVLVGIINMFEVQCAWYHREEEAVIKSLK